MESQHMTQQVFANYIGTTPATLSGIFNDRTRPTINIIESIKKSFPNISLEWLMLGQGDMYQKLSSATDDGLEHVGAEPSPSGSSSPSSTVSSMPNGRDQTLDFSQPYIPTPSGSRAGGTHFNGVRNTHSESPVEMVKIVDKQMRKVTEIRVYYDDQTWESFVPAKKS
jgi:DNA-binding XRE family transcriptional regulator